MKQINLLPWREQFREAQKTNLLLAFAGAVITALGIILIMHLIINGKINAQQNSNNDLKQKIVQLTEKIRLNDDLVKQKQVLQQRLEFMNKLAGDRISIVQLLSELVQGLPDGIYLTSIKREDNKIIVIGKAETSTQVSLLMRKIEASRWLSHPVLNEIKTAPNQNPFANDFNLEFDCVGWAKQSAAQHGMLGFKNPVQPNLRGN